MHAASRAFNPDQCCSLPEGVQKNLQNFAHHQRLSHIGILFCCNMQALMFLGVTIRVVSSLLLVACIAVEAKRDAANSSEELILQASAVVGGVSCIVLLVIVCQLLYEHRHRTELSWYVSAIPTDCIVQYTCMLAEHLCKSDLVAFCAVLMQCNCANAVCNATHSIASCHHCSDCILSLSAAQMPHKPCSMCLRHVMLQDGSTNTLGCLCHAISWLCGKTVSQQFFQLSCTRANASCKALNLPFKFVLLRPLQLCCLLTSFACAAGS